MLPCGICPTLSPSIVGGLRLQCRASTIADRGHQRYPNQIPDDFELCCKVWGELTIPTYAKQARYGAKAGQPNARFLDTPLFKNLVLAPYREAHFEPHTGPFLFEFQRHGLSSEESCGRLDTFFSQFPTDVRFAVEIRNPASLGRSIARCWRNTASPMSTITGPTCRR